MEAAPQPGGESTSEFGRCRRTSHEGGVVTREAQDQAQARPGRRVAVSEDGTERNKSSPEILASGKSYARLGSHLECTEGRATRCDEAALMCSRELWPCALRGQSEGNHRTLIGHSEGTHVQLRAVAACNQLQSTAISGNQLQSAHVQSSAVAVCAVSPAKARMSPGFMPPPSSS